jgi:hypothetical protein
LGEDVLREALGAKAAVILLRDFENQFVHAARNIPPSGSP